VAEELVETAVATGRCGAATETMRDATSTARAIAPCCMVGAAVGRFGGAAVVAVAAWVGAAMSSLSKTGGCCTAAAALETVGPVLCCRMARPSEIRGGPPAAVAEAAGERISLMPLLLGTGDHGPATLTEPACNAVEDPAVAKGSAVCSVAEDPPTACGKPGCLCGGGAGGCCCCC